MCRVLRLVWADMTPLGRAALEVAEAYWHDRSIAGRGCEWYMKNIHEEFEAQGPGNKPWWGPASATTKAARQLAVTFALGGKPKPGEEMLGALEYFEAEIEGMELPAADVAAALGDPRTAP